jgi:hypothetical protein
METPAFDIFRVDSRGSVLWIACTDTMNEAMQRAKERMSMDDLPYVILNSFTGEKTVVSP